MKTLLLFFSMSFALVAQSPSIKLTPFVTDAQGCQVLASLFPFAADCKPHVMLTAVATNIPIGSAVRFSLTYIDKSTGLVSVVSKLVDLGTNGEVGTAFYAWVFDNDFTYLRSSVQALSASATSEAN